MYPGNQDDQTRRMAAPQDQYGGQGYDQGYGQGGYDRGGYVDDRGYAEPPARRGPGIDMGKFAGSVVATAVIAALAGYLAAWVVETVFRRFGHEWANGGNTPTMYAVYGLVAALMAGLVWYLLLIGTPDPHRFFGWIVGLLIVAAVILPLLVTVPFLDGLAAAIVHLFTGLPILALTGAFGASLRR